MKKIITAVFLALYLTAGLVMAGEGVNEDSGYTLEKVVVLSRHNIRSPITSGDSMLGRVTPYDWFNWTSATSELSLKGGVLETMMGQYFRKWLESEGLIPDNYVPEDGKVRFYANSKQRTIATARYFASGMLPVAQIHIEQHNLFNEMDETFAPKLHFVTDEYTADVMEELNSMNNGAGIEGLCSGLSDAYGLVKDVIGFTDSEIYKSGEITDFLTDDTQISLLEGEEPSMTGTLKTATQISDALVLQYYEDPDEKNAAFGHELTTDEWKMISNIKDTYGDILFTCPLVAVNAAHPLLEEIASEMKESGRIFSFLCGHDSNLGSVLAALGVESYELPDSIERATPIGGKLVLSKWAGEDGSEYWKAELVYQSTQQLRENQMLSLENPPMRYTLSFEGIEANEEGMYPADVFKGRVERSVRAYYLMEDEYLGVLEDAA